MTKISLEGHRDFFLSFPSKSQFIIEWSQGKNRSRYKSKNYIRVVLSGFFPWIMFLYNPGLSALAVNQSTIKIIHYKHNHVKNLSGKFFLLWQEHCIQKLQQCRCLTKTSIMITTYQMRKGEISEAFIHRWRVTDAPWLLREGELVFLRRSFLDIVFNS